MKSYRRTDHVIDAKMLKRALQIENDACNGKLPILTEMAIPLKSFLIQAEGLRRQIAINWCLCKWCQLFYPQCRNFNHWKEELMAHLSHLNDINIKNKIDKRSHLHKMLVDDYDFNDRNTVLKVIANKFYKEHINDMAQRNVVADAFAANVDNVINVISNEQNETAPYVEETFKCK